MDYKDNQVDEIKLKVTAEEPAANSDTAPEPVPISPADTCRQVAGETLSQLQNYARTKLQAEHEHPLPLINTGANTLVVAVDVIDGSERNSLTAATAVAPVMLLMMAGIVIVCPLVWMAQHRPFTGGDVRRLRDLLFIALPMLSMMFPLLGLLGHYIAQRNTMVGRALLSLAFAPATFLNSAILGAPLAGRCLAQLEIQTGNFKAARKVLRKLASVHRSVEATLVRISAEAHVAAALGEITNAEQKRKEALKSWNELSCDKTIRPQIGRVVFNNLGASYELAGLYEDAYSMYLRALELQRDDTNIYGDATQLATSVLGIAQAASRMGRAEEANAWLDTLGEYEKDVPPWMAPHIARLRVYTAIASGNTELAYARARSLAAEQGDNSFGEINLIAGEMALEHNDKQSARAFLQEAFARQNKTLPPGHPMFTRTANAMKVALKESPTQSDVTELLFKLEKACNPAVEQPVHHAGSEDSTEERVPVRSKKYRFLFGTLILGTVGKIAIEGFRAADLITWSAFIVLTAMLVAAELLVRKRAKPNVSLFKKHEANARVDAEVGIGEAIRMDEGVLVAELGAPFDTRYGIANPGEAVLPLGRKIASKVIVDADGTPVAFEYSGKILELRTIKNDGKALAKTLGWLTAGMVIFFGGFFALINFSIDADKHVPTTLSSYEYFRWGADRMDLNWKYTPAFNNLDLVRDAWTRAAKQDPNGIAGKLATQALQSELPADSTLTPDQLNEYGKAVSDNNTLKDRDIMLQMCIKKTPRFEWPYAGLAEVRIEQGRLDDADKLLQQAAQINPNSIQYLLARAQYESARGKRDAAIATLNKARELDPFLPKPYQELLSTLLRP